MKDGWTKIKGTAEYAGVSERTCRSWIKHGLRHSRLPSGTILIQYADIDTFLNRYAVDDSKFEDVIDEILGDVF